VPIDPKSLPQDPVILQRMLIDLAAQLDKTQKLLRQLLEAKHHTKSEQLSPDQLQLFIAKMERTKAASKNDDELPPPEAGSGQGEGSQENSRPRGRRPLAPHLKRQRIEHDLSAEEKHCADCQQDLHLLGEEVSERYEYIPAQFIVIEDVCKKYGCACTIRTATKPPQPIAKSSAGASLLAQVIVGKIADHMPLHRQGKIFSRLGVDIPDQTMGGWMRQSADLLSPLYERLKTFVLSSKVTGTDDTPVRVLDKSLPGPAERDGFGRMSETGIIREWSSITLRCASALDPRDFWPSIMAIFRPMPMWRTTAFSPIQSADWWRWPVGRIRAGISTRRWTTIQRAWGRCWRTLRSCMRRRTQRGKPALWATIYVCCDSRGRVLTELHQYLLKIREEVLPKSPAGQAVSYALKNWQALLRYLEDGGLSIDNNHTERSLRGIAVGRHNWLFVGSGPQRHRQGSEDEL
jgi:transposase